MANVQHKDLPEAQLHEPKGISTAANRQVYVANGSGTGAWAKVKSENLEGLTGDGGVANKVIVTNGTGGFASYTKNAYGVMGITNNSNNFVVTAASDATLQSTADYVLFSGAGAPWVGETLYGVTFETNRLVAPVAGVYDVRFWANVSVFPSNVALVGARFKVNGTTWSPRTTVTKSNANGDSGYIGAFGLVTLAANDYIQLFVASSAAGNLVLKNANLTMELKRAT